MEARVRLGQSTARVVLPPLPPRLLVGKQIDLWVLHISEIPQMNRSAPFLRRCWANAQPCARDAGLARPGEMSWHGDCSRRTRASLLYPYPRPATTRQNIKGMGLLRVPHKRRPLFLVHPHPRVPIPPHFRRSFLLVWSPPRCFPSSSSLPFFLQLLLRLLQRQRRGQSFPSTRHIASVSWAPTSFSRPTTSSRRTRCVRRWS